MINHAYVSRNFISREIFHPNFYPSIRESQFLGRKNTRGMIVSRLPLIIETRYSQLRPPNNCSIANPARFLINQRVNGAGEQKRNIYVAIHF